MEWAKHASSMLKGGEGKAREEKVEGGRGGEERGREERTLINMQLLW